MAILGHSNLLLLHPHIKVISQQQNIQNRHLNTLTKKQVMAKQSSSSQISETVNDRRSANYQPTSWSYSFLQSIKNENADEMYKDKAKELEEEVRLVIKNEKCDLFILLDLVDDIQKMGLAYRFQEDIKMVLDRVTSLGGCNCTPKKSLHFTSLGFRLLRQHGYEVSQYVFKDFTGPSGDLLPSLNVDVKGMLSLYEASYLAREEESLLDRLREETRVNLKNLERSAKLNIQESVSHCLELPWWHRMQMLEARWYIEEYSRKKDGNQMLLELAQLDFNMAQSVLQRDLKEMSRWWNNLGLANNLRFSRDRLMECFFWTAGMVREPHFSSCRQALTKVTSFITAIDDVYDVYGTLDELEQFTKAVERWDINAMTDLPDYMKLCSLAFYNTINEIAFDALKERGEDTIPYLKKSWADLFKAFLQEAKWSYSKFTPSFEDYLENAWRSVSGTVILVHTYFLLGQTISKKDVEFLINYHEILRWPSMIFRLCNDLATSSVELVRGETINSISCYMNENGATEEQAREHMNKLIEDAWKRMNKDVIRSTFPEPFKEAALNLARISQCVYQHGDAHGTPDTRSKNKVLSLIVEPISSHI